MHCKLCEKESRHFAAHAMMNSLELCRWSDALDEVDTTIAERRPLDALQALRRIEKMVARPPVGRGNPLDTARIAQGALCCCIMPAHPSGHPASEIWHGNIKCVSLARYPLEELERSSHTS